MGEVMLKRRAVARTLFADRGEALVVTGLGSPTYDVAAESPSDLNYYLWGAMGGAAPMGLGLALAQPARRVVVVTGDGEMLMGLGALATIAAKRPANLAIVTLDNEHYGETGLQQSHAALGADLAAIAKGAGFAEALQVRTEDDLKAAKPILWTAPGPIFLNIKVAPESPQRVMPTRDAIKNKLTFRTALDLE